MGSDTYHQSSLSTALCEPPPGTWPRLVVGWRCNGERAGSIFTIDYTLRASARHPTWQAPVARPAHPPPPCAHLRPFFLPSPPHSPTTSHPILYLHSPSLPPPLPPRGPLLTLHTLTPPGPSRGGDQALLDRGIRIL